jgi:hypothetical protein
MKTPWRIDFCVFIKLIQVTKGVVMTMQIFRSALLVAGLTVGVVSAGHAGMIVDNSPVPVPVVVVPVPVQTIVYSGTMMPNVKRVSSSMIDQSVVKVLAKLVPKGWSGYASDPNIKNITKVSYIGGNRPWPVVLEEVLLAHGLVAKIDWDKREISVEVSEQGIK